MRIIAGKFKGRKIYNPTDNITRPLKDRVRESIFNIISHSNLLNAKLNQCIVLDLFSGVGSFGLEAVSRGAKKVVFFEDYKPAIKLLNKNISLLSFNKETEVYNKNIYYKNNFRILKYKFNLIFLDPPFKDLNIVTIINDLINTGIVVKGTLILIHRHKKTKDNFNQNLKIIREEIYGSSKIIFGFFNFEEF